MDTHLSLYETRVLGALIEKEATTPDQYPLSLNALVNACNQKSNREPVLQLDDCTVQQAVDSLIKKHMVTQQSGFGSRVTKIKHRFCNTEFSKLQLTEQELGLICVLFLRGPQTPGELRSRSNRLCQFSHVQQVEEVLNQLAQRDDGPFVKKLAREAGKRESRWAHLFSGEVSVSGEVSDNPGEFEMTGGSVSQTNENTPLVDDGKRVNQSEDGRKSIDADRITQLEQQVEEIRGELADLKRQFSQLLSDLG